MQSYRIPQTELVVSRIGYGCANLASWDEAPLDKETATRADYLIKTAYEQGITLFDHADVYAFGKSEAAFGKVLEHSPGLREKIVIQSKCGQRLRPGWKPGQGIGVDLSYKHILDAVEGSLRRLGTEYLDILLLHTPDALMQEDEVANALGVLRSSGKVRHFGVSNFNAAQIKRLAKRLRQPIVVNQIHAGLDAIAPITDGLEFALAIGRGATPNINHPACIGAGTLDYCRLQDIQVQAWSPLPRSVLMPSILSSPALQHLARLLKDLASANASTPAAMALAWLLRHPANIMPIIGATNPAHLIDGCSADQMTMSRDDWYELFIAASAIT
jgi:predicted oxidoreductase